MTNAQALEKFEQAHDARIAKLFWIAASMEVSDLKDMVNEMSEHDFEEAFPELIVLPGYADYAEDNDLFRLLIDNNYYGLIAEVHIPHCDGFKFDEKGKPTSWSINPGWSTLYYAYAETLSELTKKVKKISDKAFAYDIAKFKKKK